MKQQITVNQWNNLPKKAKEKLVKWTTSKRYDDLLSIGQMIEFLDEHARKNGKVTTLQWIDEKLCNYLWKEVREVLEKV